MFKLNYMDIRVTEFRERGIILEPRRWALQIYMSNTCTLHRDHVQQVSV